MKPKSRRVISFPVVTMILLCPLICGVLPVGLQPVQSWQKAYWPQTGSELVRSDKSVTPGGRVIQERAKKRDDLKREYVQGATLTRDQEKIVIELANKRGIQQVAKIYTYNIHPSTARGISVKGVEEIKGRDVSCTVLEVRYQKWWFPNQKPKKTDLQMNGFWAGQPRTEKHKILKVKMKEYRVRSVQGLQVSECEAIMELLLAKKYVLESGVNKASLEQIDWSQPKRFGKRGASISVSFDHKVKSSGFFDLQLKLDGRKLTITQLVQAIF